MNNAKDLIVAIFFSKSRNQQRIVLKFFEGKIKILKMGTLSPSLYKTDIFSSSYANFTDNDLIKIQDLIKKQTSIELKQSFYSVSVKDFADIYQILENNHCFLFDRIKKNRSYVCGYFPINKIQIHKSKEFLISRNDNILSISYTEKHEAEDFNTPLPVQIIKPKPQIYIHNDSQSPLCTLKFLYGNMAINGFSSDEFVLDSNTKYLRNKGEENRIIELLSSLGFIRKEKKLQYKSKISFLATAEKLLNNEIELFDTNEKSIKSSKSFSINISYGIDWFDIVLDHEGTNLSSNIYENINLNSHFFEFNGEKYLVPETLQKNKESIKYNDGNFIIEKNDFLTALDINSELNKSNIINLENLLKKNQSIILTKQQKKILRPYQIDGIKFLENLKTNGFGALLADDMGLGKTLQTIIFISQTKKKNCTYVVVPKSLLENWRSEINKFAPDLNVLIYHGADRKNNTNLEKYDIILSTYTTTMLDCDFLSTKKFSIVVFDEVQTIKNYKSKMYEAAYRLNADFKMALSGTPFENNILELWSIMKLLNPKIFSKRAFFTKALEEKNYDKIKKAISSFILQRKKIDVLNDLPQKTEEILYCTMDDETASTYSALHGKIVDEISNSSGKSIFMASSLILESLLKLRQFCCHPSLLPKGMLPNELKSSAKFDVLKIKVHALVAKKEKIIIFSQFTSMLGIIKKWLDKEKIKTFYLDGSTNNRQDLVNEFENSSEGVFLISLKAGGVGINLVSCHYMFIYDPWWNPASENQAADRIYRIGQQNNVFIYRMITKGTIEEKVLALQEKKQEIANSIFKNIKSEKISIDEMMELLK